MSFHRTIIRLSALLAVVALAKGCGDGDSPSAPPTPEPARPTTVMDLERATLVVLYGATDGPNWINAENWLTDAPLGEWYGVDTDASGRVVGLDLSGRRDRSETERPVVIHGLSGSIPPELGNLASLMTLDLRYNLLSGPIPPELGNLASLTTLSLRRNPLTGPIPPELGNLTGLERLDLFSSDLSGPIPPELGNLASLSLLWLSDMVLPITVTNGNMDGGSSVTIARGSVETRVVSVNPRGRYDG